MTEIGIFGLGILFGSLVVWWSRPARSTVDQQKQDRLAAVLALVDRQGKVTNDDVEEALDVSNATAGRYLQELEQSGQLQQVGSTGAHVYYTR